MDTTLEKHLLQQKIMRKKIQKLMKEIVFLHERMSCRADEICELEQRVKKLEDRVDNCVRITDPLGDNN